MPEASATVDDDQALLAAWHGGDEAAFAALVARHAALVRARCARHLPADLAEDAAQAVFLLLARKHAEAARAPCLEAWLLRVARYVVNNARRERARRIRREQEVAAMRPAATLGEDAAAADLDEALDRLPEHERRAIVLRFLRGCDDAETARILGIAQGTVRSRVSRGLERLRALLARRGHAFGVAAIAALVAAGRGSAGEPLAPTAAGAVALRLATSAGRSMTRAAAVKAVAVLLGGGALAAGVALAAWAATPASAATTPATAAPTARDAARSDPAPTPEALRALLDPDAELLAGLHDMDRARERWAASPYAAFAASPTGRAWTGAALAAAPALERIAACDVRCAAIGARGRRQDGARTPWNMASLTSGGFDATALWSVFDTTIAIVADGDARPLASALAADGAVPAGASWSLAGPLRMARVGRTWYATNRAVDATGVPAAATRAAPFVDRDADVEARFHDDVDRDGVAVTARLGADGLATVRRWTPPADAEALSEPVRFARVAALPRDAIAVWARSFGAQRLRLDAPQWPAEPNSIALSSDLFHDGASVTVTRTDDADSGSRDAKGKLVVALLRDLSTVFARARRIDSIAVDGDLIAWLQPTAPLPAISLRLDTTDADALVAALADALGVAVEANGGCRALLGGFVPIAAARVDGAIVVTTHPGGVAGCLADPGLGADPAVAARLAQAQADTAYAVVLLRDGALLRWLAGVGVVPRAQVADLAALCGERCDLIADRAAGDERACVGSGIVAGLLALLVDPGTGKPPWRGLTN